MSSHPRKCGAALAGRAVCAAPRREAALVRAGSRCRRRSRSGRSRGDGRRGRSTRQCWHGAGRRRRRCPEDGGREWTGELHVSAPVASRPASIGCLDCPRPSISATPWRWAAWARAISRPRSATGTTFWVPAGRSRSWTSPSASSSPTMTAKWACSLRGRLELLAELAAARARPAPSTPAARSSVAMRRRRHGVVRVGADHDDRGGRRVGRASPPCSSSARSRRSRPTPKPIPGVGRPPSSSTRPS